MAHTPGPWTVGGQLILSDRPYPHWKELAQVRIGTKDNWSDPEGEANARLIAAAPDLLAALKQCLPLVDAYRRATAGDGDVSAALARSVIAKAEGRDWAC